MNVGRTILREIATKRHKMHKKGEDLVRTIMSGRLGKEEEGE